MAMGRRKKERQQALFIPAAELPRTAAHPFYAKLNEVLAGWKFDEFVEQECAKFYAEKMGRPSLEPGRYFRLLLVGYFEGIDSERGIAWRCADSLSRRQFLGVPLDDGTPDHSTLTKTRKRLPADVFEEVVQCVLGVGEGEKLIEGQTVGGDST